jgi:carboxylate-amine ligase
VYSKSITSLKDLWWDIRPNLEFGTIEVRIADCPPTVKEIESIVALIHSLASYIDNELKSGREFEPPPEWVLRENKWRASRHGISCDLIADAMGTSVPFLEIWQQTKKAIATYIATFQYESQFQFAEEVLNKGPSYVRQRSHFKQGFDSLIHMQILETKRDSPIWE